LLRYELRRQFAGVECRSRAIKCDFSPDGRFLVAGSEDGRAYFFDLSSGRMLNRMDVGFSMPLCDVAWHPTEQLVAFACFGGDFPILAFDYVPEAILLAGEEAQPVDTQRSPRRAKSLTKVQDDMIRHQRRASQSHMRRSSVLNASARPVDAALSASPVAAADTLRGVAVPAVKRVRIDETATFQYA